MKRSNSEGRMSSHELVDENFILSHKYMRLKLIPGWFNPYFLTVGSQILAIYLGAACLFPVKLFVVVFWIVTSGIDRSVPFQDTVLK